MKEQIVICMPLRNAEITVAKSIESFLNQRNTKRESILLIGNDDSTDKSLQIIQSFLPNPQIQILNLNFQKTYLIRNFLNEYVRQQYPNCVLIGRLDADDVLFDTGTLKEIEQIYETSDFDILICGDQQIKNGMPLKWKNNANPKLLDNQYVLQRLLEMKQGNPKAELPSCNIVIKTNVEIEYPNVESAEDHWFLVSILLQKEEYKIHIAENLTYCFYSLDGNVTNVNRKSKFYEKSRNDLYQFFKDNTESKY